MSVGSVCLCVGWWGVKVLSGASAEQEEQPHKGRSSSSSEHACVRHPKTRGINGPRAGVKSTKVSAQRPTPRRPPPIALVWTWRAVCAWPPPATRRCAVCMLCMTRFHLASAFFLRRSLLSLEVERQLQQRFGRLAGASIKSID